jgi:hypothetical protein
VEAVVAADCGGGGGAVPLPAALLPLLPLSVLLLLLILAVEAVEETVETTTLGVCPPMLRMCG